ncbi:MAG: hypothetical protein FD153_1322 [Rhodospirillaceae bacterium]|nr:MAG: hypothetical protein FD153_1322 [Rhodospirillaceae bacterium]
MTGPSPPSGWAVVPFVALPALGGCTTHKLILPGTYRIRDTYEVQAPTVWNRVPGPEGVWAVDGPPLQSLTFFLRPSGTAVPLLVPEVGARTLLRPDSAAP